MNSPQLNSKKRYSYADYLLWDDDKRYELFDGKVEALAPAPLVRHQRVSGNIFNIFKNYLDDKFPCEVFHAPFDVRLHKKQKLADDKQIFTVIQPDIVVICDPEKIDEKGCIGPPDLIVEILSPSTSKKDVDDKFHIYEDAGVKEYWLVHPEEKTLTVFVLAGGKYQFQKIHSEVDKVKVIIFDDFVVDLSRVFK
jgi:Uma2 family endonuclease